MNPALLTLLCTQVLPLEEQRQPLKRHWNIRGKEYSFPWICTWTPNKITFVLYICLSAEDDLSSLLEKLRSKIPKLILLLFSLSHSFSSNITTLPPYCKSQTLLLLTGPEFNISGSSGSFLPLCWIWSQQTLISFKLRSVQSVSENRGVSGALA